MPAPRSDVVPFFSRRIGLLEGEEVPILVGAIGKITLVERATESRKFVYGELGAVKGEGCSVGRGR
jgi:hypothetical protein